MCAFNAIVESLLPSSGRQTTAMSVKDLQMVTGKFIIFIFIWEGETLVFTHVYVCDFYGSMGNALQIFSGISSTHLSSRFSQVNKKKLTLYLILALPLGKF